MGKIMMLNGSPRAPKSNSKQYAELFAKNVDMPTEYFAINKKNHLELCEEMENFTEVLLVFPLYADGIPVTLLNFLKTLEKHPPKQKPRISVLINCGFYEPEQNDVAVKMIRIFCEQQGYSISEGRGKNLKVTMPLPKKMFVQASTTYWLNYGKRNGITREQMETMEIEKE